MPRKPLTAAERARIDRLLDKHRIDPAAPERLERLVLALDGGRPQQAKLPRRKAGKPYGDDGAIKDVVILQTMGYELEKRYKRGLVPSISAAATILAKKEPFKVWKMPARAIFKRENEMLRRLRSGEGLQPELERLFQKRLDWLPDEARRKAKKGEK